MTKPVDAQAATELTDRRHELIKRRADLCRAQPAVWSAMVRDSDALRKAGVPIDEALEQALIAYAPSTATGDTG